MIFEYLTPVRDVSHCTRLKYFTPVTVTGHQSLYEISATVRDFELYIRDWSLAYSFIYIYVSIIVSYLLLIEGKGNYESRYASINLVI